MLTELKSRLISKIDHIERNGIEADFRIDQKAILQAKRLLDFLPIDFLIALDSADGDIRPINGDMIPVNSGIAFEYEPLLNNCIYIEIGPITTNVIAWLNTTQHKSFGFMYNESFPWMNFLKESFAEINKRKDVLYAFVVEPHLSSKKLNEYIQKYPQYEADLRALRIELTKENADAI